MPPARTAPAAHEGSPGPTGNRRRQRSRPPGGTRRRLGHGPATRSHTRPSPRTGRRSGPTGPPSQPAARPRHETPALHRQWSPGDASNSDYDSPSRRAFLLAGSTFAKQILPAQEGFSADQALQQQPAAERPRLGGRRWRKPAWARVGMYAGCMQKPCARLEGAGPDRRAGQCLPTSRAWLDGSVTHRTVVCFLGVKRPGVQISPARQETPGQRLLITGRVGIARPPEVLLGIARKTNSELQDISLSF